ncbi:Sugar transporter 11, partial [Operophtera brumata]
RSEECLKLLKSLRGSEELANEEIKEYAATTADVTISLKELLKDTIFLKSIGKSLYNAVSVYLQTIFESTKVNISPEVSSVVIGSIQLLACLCTIFLTDKFGRKPILTITTIGMAAGLGSITWMLIAELFDGASRAIGVTSSIFTTCVFIFITTKFFTTVVSAIGAPATYWFLSGNCVIVCLFVMFCLPETKGKSFLEIQQALGRESKIAS